MPGRRSHRKDAEKTSRQEETSETFARLQEITSGLQRVPEAELAQKLAEKRLKSRRQAKPVA